VPLALLWSNVQGGSVIQSNFPGFLKARRRTHHKGPLKKYFIKINRACDVPPDGKFIRETKATSESQALKAIRIAVNQALKRVPEAYIDMDVHHTEDIAA
jgi:hypothetical protein